jgi:hypothetical protein
MRKTMSKVIRTSIMFEFNVDEDIYLEMFGDDATDEELMDYARTTMMEDLIQMSYGSGTDLLDAIDVEIVNED